MTSSTVMNLPCSPSANSTSAPEKPLMSTLSPALTPFTSAPTEATLPVTEEPGPLAVSAEAREDAARGGGLGGIGDDEDAVAGGLEVLDVHLSGANHDGAAGARGSGLAGAELRGGGGESRSDFG